MTASSSSFDSAIEIDFHLDPGRRILENAASRHLGARRAPDIGSNLAEQRLIAAAKRDDHDSYRQLVEMHQDKVFRFCRHWLNGREEDAREACQDTFVRAYQALPGFRSRRNARFSTWLFRIALNLCRDRMRSASYRRQQMTDSIDENRESNPGGIGNKPAPIRCPLVSPDEQLSLREDLEKLQRGLDALPVRLREALVLATLDDLSYRQCVQLLRCSERAVEARVRRARQRLIEWWRLDR